MNSIQKRIDLFVELGVRLNESTPALKDAINRAGAINPWFTKDAVNSALRGITENFLSKEKLQDWVNTYDISSCSNKRVGTVLAGNIPLVGFHDMLSILMAGHKAVIKPSSKDHVLVTYIIDLLKEISPEVGEYISTVDTLKNYDAIIATGSNNSGQYFKQYFSTVPHIIRGNRNSIAVLSGNETEEDLRLLGKDIFTYFGLGCRNVSKLYLPVDYDIKILLEVLHEFNYVNQHHKYKNNFDYNIALYLLNKQEFYNNGSIVLKQDKNIASRIACCNYEYYESLNECIEMVKTDQDKIQCIVSKDEIKGIDSVRFGEAQQPTLMDYADGVDTMKFLSNI